VFGILIIWESIDGADDRVADGMIEMVGFMDGAVDGVADGMSEVGLMDGAEDNVGFKEGGEDNVGDNEMDGLVDECKDGN